MFNKMKIEDLSNYLGSHCRFKFRNGKDVYGVIWKGSTHFYFSSKNRHDALSRREKLLQRDQFNTINPDDILMAEPI